MTVALVILASTLQLATIDRSLGEFPIPGAAGVSAPVSTAPAVLGPSDEPSSTTGVIVESGDLEEEPIRYAAQLLDAIRDRDWRLVVSLALIGIVFLARRFGRRLKYLRGDRGGVLLTFAVASLATVSATLAADEPFRFESVLAALSMGLTAIGGYVGVRRLLWPRDNAE